AAAPLTWLYRVHGAPLDERDAIDVPIDATMQARKREALACHASQLALSAKRMARLADRPERYLPLRPTPRGLPLPWKPSRLAWPWLTLTVADRAGGGVWSWSRAPWVRTGEGDFALPASPANADEPRFAKLQGRLPSPWIFDHWGWCERPR
ncbi:MAG TPA: PIG-L family deacetylase, partial [Dyella sp.]|nr:PIG-L family deacetylase [Dyella sp.]